MPALLKTSTVNPSSELGAVHLEVLIALKTGGLARLRELAVAVTDVVAKRNRVFRGYCQLPMRINAAQ